MTQLRRRLLVLAFLGALLSGAPARAAETADALPEGARLRLGTGHFRHGDAVSRIYVLPDGKRLLTFAHDSKARMWDVAAEKELFEITLAPLRAGLYFSIAPDGKTLATANSLDRTIRLWGLADGKEILTFAPLPANQGFLDLEYSADGKMLVSSHADRSFRIWDTVAAKEVKSLAQPPNLGTPFTGRVRFLPDGKTLAEIQDWSVRVLDADDGKELRWFGGHTGPVAALTYSPDGKQMATVAADRAARLWDIANGKTVARFPLPLGGGRELAFSGDGKTLAVLCADRTVRLFDVASARQLSQVDLGPGAAIPTFALSHDGKTVFVSSSESCLHAYDAASGKALFPLTGHSGGVAALAWSPDGKRLATSGLLDRSIILWDAATGKVLHRLPPLETYAPSQMQFTPDGKALLSYGQDRTVRAWEAADGKELRSFVVSPLQPISFVFSADGKLAAVTSADRKVRVWDVTAEKELHQLEGSQAQGPNTFFHAVLMFAGDNRTLQVYATNERVMRRWDAVSGKSLGEIKGLTFFGAPPPQSSDGKSCVIVQGATTKLVEFATAGPRQTFALPPPAAPVPGGPPRVFIGTAATALSPDGRTLATTATDGTLRFWDTGSGKVLAERKSLAGNSRLLAFAPDGKTLAAAGADAGALLWEVPGPTAEGRLVVAEAPAGAVAELWKDISGEDPARAWQAILKLAASPKEAVPFLQKQLKPTAAPDAKQIAKLIADLDSEQFQEREDATEALARAGPVAEEAVRKALGNKPSAEVKTRLELILSKMAGSLGPNMDVVRATRAVEVLEKIGTSEARKVLEEVAAGDGQATLEARSAVERLKARDAAP
jgi:WD40 repeat protein